MTEDPAGKGAPIKAELAYTDLREWIEEARKLGEVRTVKGLNWQEEIGMASEVILLSDPTHAVPVQIQRNNLRTIAVGTGEPGRLTLPYLPRNADVQVDDLLVSSGLGGVFPAGLPVGRIVEVRRDPSQPLAIVTLNRPSAPSGAGARTR